MKISKAIKNLAASSEEQKEYLERLGTFPSTDELALEFEDFYKTFGNMRGDFPEPLVHKVDKLNSMLDDLSEIENYDAWDVSSLNSEEWNKIRDLSSQILKEMP